ncbi:MAG: XF1762 family protein, partial [Gammaproteobacteria bacterium]
MRLSLRPIPLRIANEFIAEHHAHHGRARGCKFSVGCYAGARLVGVVVVEHPKARYLDDGGYTLELT